MSDPIKTVQEKVAAIFSELVQDRAQNLQGYKPKIIEVMANALQEEFPPKVAQEIGFHMSDWRSDAAFIVALHLFPEKFTPEEIEAGIGLFLVHAPAHVIAAARLTENSTEDIFLEKGGKSKGK